MIRDGDLPLMSKPETSHDNPAILVSSPYLNIRDPLGKSLPREVGDLDHPGHLGIRPPRLLHDRIPKLSDRMAFLYNDTVVA